MQWQRGTRYLGKRRQRNHRRIAFGSLTGLISGFVLTLALSLVLLGAADGEAGLRLSIPGIKHAPSTSDAGSHSKTTSDVAAVPGASPSVDVTSTRGRTTSGVPTAGSTAATVSGASHPAASRPGQPVVAVTSRRSTAKPTGSTTGAAAPSAPATTSAPSVPVTTTTTQAPPPPEPSASASDPAPDPVDPAGAPAGG